MPTSAKIMKHATNSIRNLTTVLALACTLASGQAQNSRAESANSYLERGNSWLVKGEIERAIADYDLAIVFKPYVISQTYETGTTHGSPYPYDTHVPLFFFGHGIPTKNSSEPVTPQSVAAVFARAARVKPPAKTDAVLPPSLATESAK